jgi:hypothetical protein
MKRTATLCLLLVLAVGVVMAQKTVIKVEAMSPGRMEDMNVPNPTDVHNVSSGLTVVGVGTKVWLSGWDATGDTAFKTASSYLWSFVSKPTGSTVALDSTTTQWTGFRPDALGDYVVKLVIGSKDTSVRITGANYVGVDRNNVAPEVFNCASCHASAAAPEKFAEWKDSPHATVFEHGMNGTLSSHWSERCFQCHTVGYDTLASNRGFDDVAAGLGFVATQWMPWRAGLYDSLLTTNKKAVTLLAGIGCESCHGPKNPNHFGPGTQPKTMDAGVCAQCHNEPPQHSGFLQWENSGHASPPWESGFASTGTTPVTSYTLSACVRCHDGGAFKNFTEGQSFDNRSSTGYGYLTRTNLDCQTCHDPHSTELRQAPASSDTLGNGYNYSNDSFGSGAICLNCHKFRRDANSYVKTTLSSRWGPHYFGAADLILGQNGYTFGDNLLPDLTKSGHMSVENTCVGCHMQATPTNSPATNKTGGHTWKISYAAPDGTVYENLTVCMNCHTDIENTKAAFEAKIDGLMKKIAMNLPPYGSENIDWSLIASDKNKAVLEQVYWNYQYVKNGGSAIHNPRYTTYLLQRSLQALGVSTDVEPLAGLVPSTYELSQNYPNPFNPTTQIRFSLPRESDVKLVVFDIVGRVVTTLVDQKMSAGVHQVTWNGRDQDGQSVASGVYFYHIQAAGFSATKKMALIK